jgi:hypothetical protein
MKNIFTILLTLFLVGCIDKPKNYVCKNTYQIPDTISLKVENKKLIFGTDEFIYCENKGNSKIYHKNCKKNQYGNYESSIIFDPIIKQLLIIGSGGIAPVDLFNCSYSN